MQSFAVLVGRLFIFLMNWAYRFVRLGMYAEYTLSDEEMLIESEQNGPGFMGSSDQQIALDGVSRAIITKTLYDGTLRGMNFGDANLIDAPLRRAYLVDVSLRDTLLLGADLRGAILHGADLREADLSGALFNRNTMLPDGSRWSPDADLSRFTDPDHADFFDVDQT